MADMQMVPAELQGDHTVKLIRTEFRGETQYQADQRVHDYKFVMDTSRRRHLTLQEGETWLVMVERVAGNIAFCYMQKRLLTRDGLPPVVSATKTYVERHCKVTINVSGGERIELPVAAVEGTEDAVTIKFVDGITRTLPYFSWKQGAYGRYVGRGYIGGKDVNVIFWEN